MPCTASACDLAQFLRGQAIGFIRDHPGFPMREAVAAARILELDFESVEEGRHTAAWYQRWQRETGGLDQHGSGGILPEK